VADRTKQREALLRGVVALLVIGAVGALCVVAFRRSVTLSAESSQDSWNKLAIERALGFTYTGLDETIWILQVEPGGPFDKAGLQRHDVVVMSRLFTTSLLSSRGRTLVLPAERKGKPFRVTVTVPHFTIPHPARLRSRVPARRP
jgi:predicted metalloprotease with PDZ domain